MKPQIQKLFDQYHGNLSQKIARKNGIHTTTLNRLVEKGELEKDKIGVYTLPEVPVDYYFAIQQRYTTAIFSFMTALTLYDLIKLNTINYDLTFSSGSTRRGLERINVCPHYTTKENLFIGAVRMKSPIGNEIMVYDIERTICDIWSKRTKVDIETRNLVIDCYLNSQKRDISKLKEYCDIFPVSKGLLLKL